MVPEEAYWPPEQGIIRVEAPRYMKFAQMVKMSKISQFGKKNIFSKIVLR